MAAGEACREGFGLVEVRLEGLVSRSAVGLGVAGQSTNPERTAVDQRARRCLAAIRWHR